MKFHFIQGDLEEKTANQLVDVLVQAGFNANYSKDVKYSIWKYPHTETFIKIAFFVMHDRNNEPEVDMFASV